MPDGGPAAYCGRFAPTPSGPLHRGSLVAALGSWLDARASGGRWRVRIDDLDGPRCVAGADRLILGELERLGLTVDGPVTYQRDNDERYRRALQTLAASGATFDCGCTRRETAGGPYPGTCRAGLAAGRSARAVRVRVPDGPVEFEDRRRGTVRTALGTVTGDFVVRRADGIVAYHLACVLDDHALGVTDIVRGRDLADSAPPQTWLRTLLDLPAPRHLHLPVLTGTDGRKLSKHNHAPATLGEPVQALWRDTLRALGIAAPDWPAGISVERMREWALGQWRAGAG